MLPERILAEERNPVGVGFAGKRGAEELAGHPVPNLEDPTTPLEQLGQLSKPACLARTSKLLGQKAAAESALREAIEHDLDALDGDLDGYARRLHTATLLRAIAEARPQ